MRRGIIKWEKEHGYKSKFVAEKIGVSDAVWCNIKKGRQNPTFPQIEKLRAEFGLKNVLDLLRDEA